MSIQEEKMSIISKPPNVISVKDNIHICDMLAGNLMGIKTIKEFGRQSSDQEIINILEATQKMHAKHYNLLLESLENCEN